MLEFNEILKLIDKVNESSYSEFEIEHGSFKLKMKKHSDIATTLTQSIVKPESIVSQASNQSVVETPQQIKPVETNYKVIKSPMVGTFYSKPSPEASDYVKVGDRVSKETTVCIVEAMKLFNEIHADIDGEIVEILVENGQLVEYGQALFHVR